MHLIVEDNKSLSNYIKKPTHTTVLYVD